MIGPARGETGLQAAQRGDFATARAIWTEEARAGDPAAAYNLGRMYTNGDGVRRSNQKAFEWYGRAVEGGLAQAQFQVGYMYAVGEGVQTDLRKAIIWTGRAARQGHAQARGNLPEMQTYVAASYRSDDQDIVRAWGWYSLAGENGSDLGREMARNLRDLMQAQEVRRAEALLRECRRTGYVSCD
ncbi:tetratricopeptide repeat protein [Jannaschia seohaensis]|uniref:tetratricopeptide repeat protein n=1 Tax=Jannaschia seohaensis TaxID=475081 RepID=UPI0014738E26|nr:tetratricopeptide repeat protein [Jannaschia seohaensis]